VGRRLAVVLLIVVLIVVADIVRLFVWPPKGEVPVQVDSVALLSGGSGDRLPRALALVRRGVADVLVIPNGTDPKWGAARRLCTDEQPFEVVCPTPRPDTTQGEALALDRLARQRKWDDMVVVTSRYHVSRARVLLERCVSANVAVVASVPSDGPVRTLRHVLHEAVGLVDSVAIHRSC
jgi:uncharacterized SAM-binding protein YcdF (DUF218 family)